MTKTANIKEPTSIWNRSFILVCIAAVFMHFGMQMSQGILAPYTAALGGSASEVGMVTSAFALTALLLKAISAPILDSFNRKKVFSIAMLGTAVAFAGYAFSTSVFMVGTFSLVRGAAMAFTSTAALVIATDFLPKNQLGKGIGIFTLAQAICQALAPMIALNLALVIGYEGAYMVAAVVEVLGSLVVLTIKRPSCGTEPFRISLSSMLAKEAAMPAIVLALMCGSFFSIYTFVVLYGLDQGISQEYVGSFFLVLAGAMLLSRPLMGSLSDKIGFKKAMVPALVSYAAGFALLSQVDSLFGFCVVAVLMAFGYGVAQPLTQALAMKLVPPEHFGAASCTCYVGNDIGALIGPNIAGLLVELLGCSSMWLCMLVPVAFALVVVVAYPLEGRESEVKL
ncbi:MAG: MFS transporter [Eggerthellaceae bacterium]|nr:MFS transporter [Eggerthellaceae bacterium]